MHPTFRLILGSQSTYRAQALGQLGLPFEQLPAHLDEQAQPTERFDELATRLAREKANAVADSIFSAANPSTAAANSSTSAAGSSPSAAGAPIIVIGSDQVAVGPGGQPGSQLHKPGTAERAERQLASLSGQQAVFYTALHLLYLPVQEQSNSTKPTAQSFLDVTKVTFRKLSDEQIQAYVRKDQPEQCAGGFKVESLGITLFEKVESEDPSALVGLPLISLTKGLLALGIDPITL